MGQQDLIGLEWCILKFRIQQSQIIIVNFNLGMMTLLLRAVAL